MNGPLEVVDHGDRRRVVVCDGVEMTSFETSLSADLVRRFFAVKGTRWMKDAIDRTEDAEYLERPLERLIARFAGHASAVTVLDLGCGLGASSVVLTRLGFKVVGVEPGENLVGVGARLVKEQGVDARVGLVVGAGESLPIRPESVDMVMLCAVIEHVPPAHRTRMLHEAWRALRPGGLLFIHDTPNALWPHDDHTTGLWFATWLPSRLAYAYARRCSRRYSAHTTDEELVSGGLFAPTYWEIRRALPAAECLNLAYGDDVRFAFAPTDHKPRPFLKAVARRALVGGLRFVGGIARRVLGVPAAAVLHNFDLCFRKPSRNDELHAHR